MGRTRAHRGSETVQAPRRVFGEHHCLGWSQEPQAGEQWARAGGPGGSRGAGHSQGPWKVRRGSERVRGRKRGAPEPLQRGEGLSQKQWETAQQLSVEWDWRLKHHSERREGGPGQGCRLEDEAQKQERPTYCHPMKDVPWQSRGHTGKLAGTGRYNTPRCSCPPVCLSV